MKQWHIYLIRTGKGELYTGITTDVARRFAEHCAGGPKSARYLRGRGPLAIVFSQKIGSRSEAAKIEWTIKKLPKAQKRAIISGRLSVSALSTN